MNTRARHRNVSRLRWIGLFCIPLVFGCNTPKRTQLPEGERPVTWAVLVEKPGVPNLFQVSPILFRGAQPSHEGMLQLEQIGVKAVIDLRGLHDDKDQLTGVKLSRISIRFHTWHPEEEDMVKFLKAITNTNKQPVFVHCKRGIDRTGTMVALYRIAVQGWTKDEAIREMTRGGYGYDDMFPNLVAYVNGLDVTALQKKAGIYPEK
jgi:protein tyrosine phosphatase (PTP) superfamily phosphohydrolase (DUF442 family)